MAKRRRSPKPCIGRCGEETYDWDYLCNSCRHELEIGREILRLKDASGQDLLTGTNLVQIVWWDEDFAPRHNQRDFKDMSFPYSKLTDEIEAIIREIANLIPDNEEYRWKYYGDLIVTDHREVINPERTRSFSRRNHTNFYAKPGVGTKINQLCEAINALCAYYYSDGVDTGKNFVRRIANGELTVEELQAIERKKQ